MASRAEADRLILSKSRPLRLFTLFIFYVAQGVPLGLFWFAIPAWMATNGATAGDVAFVLGFTTLPWSLKLINGFIMDRYTFLPMGRRRVWLIGAQMLMIGCLLACAAIRPSVDQLEILAAAGFIINTLTTFQDVAVDGLAVDIMEEEERARGSGMMFGGQAIGIAAATALSGAIIAEFGSSAAYLTGAAFIAFITLYAILLREREGERRLPWSRGQAHTRNLAIQAEAWLPILKTTLGSMIKVVSLLWIPLLVVRGIYYGICTGLTPLIGTQEVGWTEDAITSTTGTGGLLAGLSGLTIGGFLGDRLGAKKSTALMFALIAIMLATMVNLSASWSDETIYRSWVYAWLVGDTLITVVALPISMRLCDPRVAATQFTLYMACSNMGTSLGAWALGISYAVGGFPSIMLITAVMMGLGVVAMLAIPFPRKAVSTDAVVEGLPLGEELRPARD